MGNKRPPFKPDTIYHVYNHGNAEDNIFREEENYRYFLKQYAHYIYPIAKTYAFCLLPNHFHLMIRVRSLKELIEFFEEKDPLGFGNPKGLSESILSNRLSNQFGTFLNSYTKSFNKYYDRTGSLFRNTTKRKPITNNVYYTRLITYIHQNPIHHGFVEYLSEWPFSSYQIFQSRQPTQLSRREVLEWFGGKDAFIENHQHEKVINREEFY